MFAVTRITLYGKGSLQIYTLKKLRQLFPMLSPIQSIREYVYLSYTRRHELD